jgi:hypothetical protein
MRETTEAHKECYLSKVKTPFVRSRHRWKDDIKFNNKFTVLKMKEQNLN